MHIETKIASVVVYPDRARITRGGESNLESGFHRLEISGLPLQANPESVRAAARGTAKARLLGVQVQPEFFAETPVEAVRELEAKVEAAQDALAAAAARIAGVERAQARLESLAGHTDLYAAALASGDQTVEAQLDLFEQMEARSAAYAAESLRLAAEQRAAERRLHQLQAQLAQARSQRPPARYSAAVEVEVLQPGSLAVELSYIVSSAGWKPLYDLRLDDADPPRLEIGYLAQVTQSSGEIWKDVDLTLSTARPALAGRVPEITPWFIQPAPPPRPLPTAPMIQAKMMRADRMEDSLAMGAVEAAPAEEIMASVETSGAAVSYRIPGSVTISPDGTSQKVVIARYDLPPRLDYVSAPALAAAVYRRARVANASAYTLLPGAANLFAGDEFLGTTKLELTPPQGEIELFLGVDDRLPIERELVRREVDKTLVGGRRRVRYGYEIRLENRLSHPAEVSIRDRFPVSRHEDIKVRLERAEPQPVEQTELNRIEWVETLKAGDKRRIRFDFTVEHPAALEVQGISDF